MKDGSLTRKMRRNVFSSNEVHGAVTGGGGLAWMRHISWAVLYSEAMFACCERHFRYLWVVGWASGGELYFA